MNFQFYLEKLFASPEFEEFKKEFPKSFLCSGFFSIDKEGKDNQQHLDFFIPDLRKMFSFKLGEVVEKIPVDDFGENFIPESIADNYNFSFEEIERMVENKMKEDNINKKIQKILLSLQRKGGKDFLVGTIFISGLGMIKVKIDLSEKKIVEFEKKSFFDMIKVVK